MLNRDRRPQKILLVAGSYSEDSKEGQQGFTKEQINHVSRIISQTKSEILIFSLFSHCSRNRGIFNARLIFNKCPTLKTIALEVGDLWEEDNLIMEIHQRHSEKPNRFKRHLACGADPIRFKEAFIKESRDGLRHTNGIEFLYCGSINIIRYSRNEQRMIDEFGYLETLKNIHTIFVPFHTAPIRWEIAEKQKFISKGGRLVVTLWNKMDRPERRTPWRAFYDGIDSSNNICELKEQFLNQNGVRVGFILNPPLS